MLNLEAARGLRVSKPFAPYHTMELETGQPLKPSLGWLREVPTEVAPFYLYRESSGRAPFLFGMQHRI
jgi:hypothetical protein